MFDGAGRASFCRLDLGEAKTWQTLIWPTIDGWVRLGLDRDTPLMMRAAVQWGTGGWQRSPRRNGWVTPAGVTGLGQAARSLADRGNARRRDRGAHALDAHVFDVKAQARDEITIVRVGQPDGESQWLPDALHAASLPNMDAINSGWAPTTTAIPTD